jgi:hypothetical protein
MYSGLFGGFIIRGRIAPGPNPGATAAMNITMSLSPDEEKELLERASILHVEITEYVHRIIARHIRAPDALDALLAPLRQQFADSGTSEEELDSLVEEAREEVWREKHGRPSKGS